MTCKEKYMKDYPNDGLGLVTDCPSSYGYLDDPEYCAEDYKEYWECAEDCEKCWGREIPEENDNKSGENIMTCKEKLTREHPEWSEVSINLMLNQLKVYHHQLQLIKKQRTIIHVQQLVL